MATNFTDIEAMHNPSRIAHLYVHIPFCARICPYCAFYKTPPDRLYAWRFCQAILCELDTWRGRLQIIPETIFFGGGTPTALNIGQLQYLLEGIRDRLDLTALREWTLEANPGSVSRRKAAMLRRLGVNRMSLGIQSWDNGLLKLLGREHNAAQAEDSYHMLREAGFDVINIDLMFGVPGQTVSQWEDTLQKTVQLGPEHISTYCLTYEEDTEFFARQARGEFHEDSDSDARFLEMTMQILEAAGFDHYEISNYARSGRTSVHNRAYWAGHDYLGLGPGAFSTIGLERHKNLPDYRRYTDQVLTGRSVICSMEHLTAEMKRSERIALGLRTGLGIPSTELDQWPNERQEFIALGLLREVNGHHILTPQGKLVADSVAEAFL